MLLLTLAARARGGYIGGFGQGFAARVYAVAVHEGALVAAGVFDADASGTVPLGRVARFDPQGWQALGPPVTHGELRCLLSWGGDLIAGGDFTMVGGTPARSIARWDGRNWTALGGGIRGGVRALAQFGGDLVVGGDFTAAGGAPCYGLARWDGAQWHAMGLGRATGQVRALSVYQGSLYVGGTQIDVPGTPAGGYALARWDGATWHGVGAGFKHGELVDVPSAVLGVTTPATVLALTEYDGRLVIGGQFRQALNGSIAVSADGLMQWDGADFSRVGGASLGPTDVGGIPAASSTRSAFALAVHDGLLFVAGAFQGVVLEGGGSAGGSNLAIWDGAGWLDPDAPSLAGDVTYAASSLPSVVALGGRTAFLGGRPFGYLAQWSPDATAVAGSAHLAATTALGGASPNPFNPRTVIHFSVGQPGRGLLSVHDAAGRRVRVLADAWLSAGMHAIPWDGADAVGRPVASGVYFVRLETAGGGAVGRVALVR